MGAVVAEFSLHLRRPFPRVYRNARNNMKYVYRKKMHKILFAYMIV